MLSFCIAQLAPIPALDNTIRRDPDKTVIQSRMEPKINIL